MAKYSLTALAQNDLKEILAYIGLRNSAIVRKVKNRFFDAFRNLATNPQIGHIRDELTNLHVRFWRIYSYQIIYKSSAEGICIIRILSSYRDIQSILTESTLH